MDYRLAKGIRNSKTWDPEVQYKADLFWGQSATSESMADDLRLAHRFMDLCEHTADLATARECYDKARSAHDAVDRLLRNNLPQCAVTRKDLGTAIARLRGRLAAFESGNCKS